MMAYASLAENRLDFHLGRQDVTDHRKAPDRKTSMGVPGASILWDYPRLDVGRMALRPTGKIKCGTLRQDLWNAEITGTITTDLGELKIRAFTPRDRMVQIIQVNSTEKTAAGKPADWKWEFLPGNPMSPRAIVFPDQAKKVKYVTNPNPVLTEQDGLLVCVQSLTAGGDYATAWQEKPVVGTRSSTLFIATANEVPAAGKSAAVAIQDIKSAASLPFDSLLAEHRKWWHAFYPEAFLTIPDARMEAFYWIQIYKLAAASREGGPAVDLFGPWFRTCQWPGIWWNLNIQLTYWPVYAGNRLALGTNYLNVVDSHFEELFAGFKDAPTLGDFAWAMHNYWWQLRFAGDWQGLHDRWSPKAKAVLAAYLPRLKENAAGRLELGEMGSPEYQGFRPYPNTNYNLSILRWLLNSLLEADARTGKPGDPATGEWKRILEKLIDYPVDQHGLRIASNQSVDMSHRHYSHLLALYPLYQLDPTSVADRDLVVKSVLRWHRVGNGKGLAGYSFTGGTSLYASLGMGNEARDMMHRFLTGNIGISNLLPSTHYVESGGRNPVIETPLIYMIAAIQTAAYRTTKDAKYLDRAAHTAATYLKKLQKEDGLFWHAEDSPYVWGRGAGWYAAGMTEILKLLPADHPQREAILVGYRKTMAALLKHQAPSGLWRQLVDKPESWEETSGSGMFAYAMVTGVRRGWLDEATYGPVARKAWLALVAKLDDKGNLRDVCVGTNKAAKEVGPDIQMQLQFYLDRPRYTGDYHGQAPLLWTAAALMERAPH